METPSPYQPVLISTHIRRFVDGAAASCIAEAVSLPLEVAKMRLQLQREDKVSLHGPRYTGMLNAFSTIVRQERWFSLWKGLEAGIHKQFLYTGLRLGLYEHLSSGTEETPTYLKLVYAGLTTGIGILAANPADVVQTRYIAYRQSAPSRLHPVEVSATLRHVHEAAAPATATTPPSTAQGRTTSGVAGGRAAPAVAPAVGAGKARKQLHSAAHAPAECYKPLGTGQGCSMRTPACDLAHQRHVHHHHWRYSSTKPVPPAKQVPGSGPRTVTGVPLQNARRAYLIILKEEGLAQGLYRGFSANFACNCCQGAAEIATYDVVKSALQKAGWRDGMPLHLGAGMTAGLVATIVSNPLDVVATRLMAAKKAQLDTDASLFRMIAKIWRREGFLAFFKGFGPNVGRIGMFNIVLWLSYEQIRKI